MKLLIERLKKYLVRYRSRLIFVFLLAIPVALIKSSQAYIIKFIVDDGLLKQEFQETLFYSLSLVALQLIGYPIRFFHFFGVRTVSEKMASAMRTDLIEKIGKIDLLTLNREKEGELVSLISLDVFLISEVVRAGLGWLREPLLILGYLTVLLSYDWVMTVAAFGIIPIFAVLFSFFGKKMRGQHASARSLLDELSHEALEMIHSIRSVKLLNIGNFLYQRFSNKASNTLEAQKKVLILEDLARPLNELIGSIGLVAVLAIAFFRIRSGDLTTGEMVGFLASLALMVEPIKRLSEVNLMTNKAKGSSDRVFRLLAMPEEKLKNEDVEPKSSLKTFESLEFKGISFSFPGSETSQIENFNLRINRGDRIALVGDSGSGKSTILKILMGFYRPTEGEIFLNENPLGEISLTEYRRAFTYVGQKPFLFNRTLEENIWIDEQTGDKEYAELLRMTDLSGLDQDLKSRENSRLGNRGDNLSGGQGQRVALARGLSKNAPVLILDESTSALDQSTESHILNELFRLNKTLIVVAHRLSSLVHFDQIAVLREGTIAEMGTYEELMAKKSYFYELYQGF